jgi:DNA-binding Lrp family transcriptional regulator
MTKLKEIDFKTLFELMKNSKASDRKLANKIGLSQPTVTRRRAKLEKAVIESYTAIPKWDKLGYGILSVVLVKAKLKFASREEVRDSTERSLKWLAKQPSVIFGSGCRGMGMTGVMFCLHKDYAAFDKFMSDHREQLGDILEDVQAVIVNLSGGAVYRPINLKYLAEGE